VTVVEKNEVKPVEEQVVQAQPEEVMNAEPVAEVQPDVAPAPKRRGRPRKTEVQAVVEEVSKVEEQPEESAPIVEEQIAEADLADTEGEDKTITIDDFTASIIGEGVLEIIPDGYSF
jgi:hypothetical protein